MIVITTTATCRPEILERTFSSFRRNLFTDDVLKDIPVKLMINIDRTGPGSIPDVINVCAKYFKDIKIAIPATPSFPRAFCWLWNEAAGEPDAEFVFHLEDDWELMRPVDLTRMISILRVSPLVQSLRLPAFHAYPGYMKNWGNFFMWTGNYYEPPEGEEWLGFCGHPSLIKAEFVRRCAPLIDPGMNPEKQFHRGNPALNAEFHKWKYVVYGEPADPLPLIMDIGRDWMVENGYSKKGSKAFFTEWERQNG